MENPAAGQANPIARRWVGERGLRLATGAATLSAYAMLRERDLPEIEDIIPADDSILLVIRRGMTEPDGLGAVLGTLPASAQPAAGVLHTLPATFDGPDLADLAVRTGLHPDDYVRRFIAVEFRVAFIGFQPGFPYLRGLPPALQAPRRSTPRTAVPAGSVAIGGAYAGIYPAAGPGGWHLVGRSATSLFDPSRDPPARLQPGDRVRFVPA